MGDQGSSALAALILGSVVAVLLFIPVAAVQYRRDGRLGPGRPDGAGRRRRSTASRCGPTRCCPCRMRATARAQRAQTQLMAFADDIRRAAQQSAQKPGYAGLGTPGRAAPQPGVPPGRPERGAVPAVRGVRAADHAPRRGGGDGARVRGVTADRGHAAHGGVGRVPVRLPAVRRRRPADQHAGRVPRRGRLLPVRRPPTPAGSAPPAAGCRARCRWAGAWPATLQRRPVRGARWARPPRRCGAGTWCSRRIERPATDSTVDDRAAGGRAARGAGAGGAARRQDGGRARCVDLRTSPASYSAPAW